MEDGAIRLQAASTTRSSAAAGARSWRPRRSPTTTALVAACRFVLVDDVGSVLRVAPGTDRRRSEADAALGPAVQAAARACLKPYVQPAAVLFAKELPRTRTEQDRSARVSGRGGARARDRPPPGPPTSTTTNAVLDAFSAVLGRPVTGDTSFAALGGTSLQAVEAAWRLGVAPDDVLSLSIGELAPLVDSRAPAPARRRKCSGNAAAEARPHEETMRRAWALQGEGGSATRAGGSSSTTAARASWRPTAAASCASTRAPGRRSGRRASALGDGLRRRSGRRRRGPRAPSWTGRAFVGGYDGRVYAVAVADGTLRGRRRPCAARSKAGGRHMHGVLPSSSARMVASAGPSRLPTEACAGPSEPLGGAVFARARGRRPRTGATTAGVAARAPGGDASAPTMAQSRRARVCATRGPRGPGHLRQMWPRCPCCLLRRRRRTMGDRRQRGAGLRAGSRRRRELLRRRRPRLVFRDATSGALKHRRSTSRAKFFKAPVLVNDARRRVYRRQSLRRFRD